MLIKLTVKEMAALALALQERPEETREDHKKIVPPETESRNGFFIGDLVICRALDEWAGGRKGFRGVRVLRRGRSSKRWNSYFRDPHS